jgi:dTDP-4-dehydrorhamnose reductase
VRAADTLLVVGADGLIGRELARQLRDAGKPVIETTRRKGATSTDRIFLDLSTLSESHLPAQPSVSFLCASITRLEQCRTNPEKTAAINVRGTISLAKSLIDRGSFVVFLSTNLVYDGSVPFQKASCPVNPQSEYGRQKAAVERELLSCGGAVAIVRLTKVLSPDASLFKGWISALRAKNTIHPFSDVTFSPVSLSFVVEVLIRVATRRLSGIIQVSATEDITYQEAAFYLARRLGVCQELVQPVRASDAGLHLEDSPRYTSLDTNRIEVDLDMKPPNVWTTMKSVFDL